MLMRPEAWDILSHDEKAEILALFPHDSWILDPETPHAQPNTALLMSNTAFRSDCVGYARGIERGHHANQWLQEAWEAHKTHLKGGFDDYLSKEFKTTWGEDMPPREYQSNKRARSMRSDDRLPAEQATSPAAEASSNI